MTRRISRHCFSRRSTSTSASLSSTGSLHAQGAASSAAKRNAPLSWRVTAKHTSTRRVSSADPLVHRVAVLTGLDREAVTVFEMQDARDGAGLDPERATLARAGQQPEQLGE